MSDIFLSYKREEQAAARRLADAIEREGWSVWWDPKLRAGEHFDDVIEEVLKESKCVIVMWSKLSVKSRYVKDEATYALNRRKLVPVVIENVEVPFRFEALHTPLLVGWDGSYDFPEFRKLVDDINTLMSNAVLPASRPSIRNIPERGTTFRDTLEAESRVGPEMIIIPPGSFEMGDVLGTGSFHERPVHEVQIRKSFAIGRSPVTFYEYEFFAQMTRQKYPEDLRRDRARPVTNVTWHNAVEYAKWLSQQTGKHYRLPTEAEWEYAARSGGKTEIWAGTSNDQQLSEYAWFRSNSNKQSQPVRRRNPNGLGLYDMSGNVWEWVTDCWHENYAAAPQDGSVWLEAGGGTCELRVVRGGSWYDEARSLRTSNRDWGRTHYCDKGFGFRLARDIE